MSKTVVKFVLAVLMIAGLIRFDAVNAEAAATTGTADAVVQIPLIVNFVDELNFGTYTVEANTAGTVTINAIAAGNSAVTGGANWFPNPAVVAGTSGPGRFGLVGEPNRTYNNTGSASSVLLTSTTNPALQLGASLLYYSPNGANPPPTTTPGPALNIIGALNGLGVDEMRVGGTLLIPAQPLGFYTGVYSGLYNVTVNYE